MAPRIFQEVVLVLFVLLVGQINIQGRTIGAHFVNALKQTGEWIYVEAKKTRMFSDVQDIKRAFERKTDDAKAAKSEVDQGIGKTKTVADDIERKLAKVVEEARDSQQESPEDFSDELEEDKSSTITSADQETILKNLP